MKRIEIRDLYKTYADFADKEITVCGWARTVRDSKTSHLSNLMMVLLRVFKLLLKEEKLQIMKKS